MQILDRRSVMRATPLAAAVTGAAIMGESIAYGSSAAPRTSVPATPTPTPSYSKDLALWMQQKLIHAYVKSRTGTIRPSHLQAASRAVRMYANHLHDAGIDLIPKTVASLVDLQHTDLSLTPEFEQFHARVKDHDQTIQREELAKMFRFTPEQLAKGQAAIRNNGLSSLYHATADHLNLLSRMVAHDQAKSRFNRGHIVTAGYRPGDPAAWKLSDGVYHPSQAPRFERTGYLCNFMKAIIEELGIPDNVREGICNVLTDAGIIAGISAVGAAVLCDGAVILSILATDGVAAVIAGPLETLLCDAASIAAGATVAGICAVLTCAFAC